MGDDHKDEGKTKSDARVDWFIARVGAS